MLMNLNRKDWTSGLIVKRFEDHHKSTEVMLDKMVRLSKDYCARVKEEEGRSPEEVEVMRKAEVDEEEAEVEKEGGGSGGGGGGGGIHCPLLICILLRIT